MFVVSNYFNETKLFDSDFIENKNQRLLHFIIFKIILKIYIDNQIIINKNFILLLF